MSALELYYALPLWGIYMRAFGAWEMAHETYVKNPCEDARAALLNAEEEKNFYLARLRQTPEHKAAFGW